MCNINIHIDFKHIQPMQFIVLLHAFRINGCTTFFHKCFQYKFYRFCSRFCPYGEPIQNMNVPNLKQEMSINSTLAGYDLKKKTEQKKFKWNNCMHDVPPLL